MVVKPVLRRSVWETFGQPPDRIKIACMEISLTAVLVCLDHQLTEVFDRHARRIAYDCFDDFNAQLLLLPSA
jgi:hypothetical protein